MIGYVHILMKKLKIYAIYFKNVVLHNGFGRAFLGFLQICRNDTFILLKAVAYIGNVKKK